LGDTPNLNWQFRKNNMVVEAQRAWIWKSFTIGN
jgi:hypothetical protein